MTWNDGRQGSISFLLKIRSQRVGKISQLLEEKNRCFMDIDIHTIYKIHKYYITYECKHYFIDLFVNVYLEDCILNCIRALERIFRKTK